MMSWMWQAASDWPALMRATLEPGLIWPRAVMETYRSLLMPALEQPRPVARRLTVITPVPAITEDDRAEAGADPSATGLYAAMDREELAEVTAYHAAHVGYGVAWQEMQTAGRGAVSVAHPRLATTPEQIAWTEELPSVGQSAATIRTFHHEHVEQFAHLSGDKNPLHLHPEAWVGTPFTGNLVHGALTASLFSQLMGMELPGPGAVYLSQSLKFQAPVYIGEAVSATVTVIQVRIDKRIITLETHAEVTRDGEPVTVLEGEAVVKLLAKPTQGDSTPKQA